MVKYNDFRIFKVQNKSNQKNRMLSKTILGEAGNPLNIQPTNQYEINKNENIALKFAYRKKIVFHFISNVLEIL